MPVQHGLGLIKLDQGALGMSDKLMKNNYENGEKQLQMMKHNEEQ